MKFLVSYAHEKGYGNIDVTFENSPPTMNDIREAEQKISKRSGSRAVILNWLEVSDSATKRHKMTERIMKLRKYVQFDFYTVDEKFVLQLFEKEVAANDGVDCIWENDHFDVEALFEQAIAWCEDRF